MTADSTMRNIALVEQYARELEQTSFQVEELFNKLKHKTDEIGQNWSDSQFNQFRQIYNDVIMKQTKGTADTLRKLAAYTKKQCEYQQMVKQHKLNL